MEASSPHKGGCFFWLKGIYLKGKLGCKFMVLFLERLGLVKFRYIRFIQICVLLEGNWGVGGYWLGSTHLVNGCSHGKQPLTWLIFHC